MEPNLATRTAALVLAFALRGVGLDAQAPLPGDDARTDSVTIRGAERLVPLAAPGSAREDRSRIAQLLGHSDTGGFLVRSTSSGLAPLPGPTGSVRWAVLAPEALLAWNSDIPYTQNDRSLWAGRGWSALVQAGVRAEWGPVSLVLAPQVTRSWNRDFEIVPPQRRDLTVFRAPWRSGLHSGDLPLRFGSRPFTRLDPGETSLSVRMGPVTGGWATESQWWGPGVQSALLLSNHAPGIPHVFARTSDPVRTPFGDVEAKLLAGALTESLYFDADPDNDLRSIGAAAVTFRPRFDPGLTLGVARSVVSSVEGTGELAEHALDALLRWEGADTLAAPDSLAGRDGGSMQVLSVFGRWVLPNDGFEVYAEWARHQLPTSLRDLLYAPHHTQGYTVGLQWARPVRADSAVLVRLRAEATYLEESSTQLHRRAPGFYSSPSVVQGYTQRGQSIGAGIGPGASAQWLGGDYLARRWSLGAKAGRVRWDNAAYYAQPTGGNYHAHDVSLLLGGRGGIRGAWGEITGELTREWRYNYLFQNRAQFFGGEGAVDVRNWVFRLGFSSR